MDNNLSVKILETYMDVDKIHDDISQKMFQFINKATELIELSEDMYQVERTIKLNKISLKGYILDSPCCKQLERNNISNYSIEELKQYLINYEKTTNENCSPYYLAISLYELLEQIEHLVDKKVELAIYKLSELVPIINDIKNTNNEDYETLYNQIKNELHTKYLNSNLIDDKSFNVCVRMVNDIFNYYISGYPDIPVI